MHWLLLGHAKPALQAPPSPVPDVTPTTTTALDTAPALSTSFPFPNPADFRWTDFDVHASVAIGIALVLALYFWGLGPARRRFALSAQPATRGQVLSFLLAHAVLFLSLNGPLHHLSDYYLFSGHMVQHLLLTQVYPPLLLLGTPGWLLAPLFRWSWLVRLTNAVVRPFWAFLISTAVLVFWHIPGPYDLTMRDHDVHILEHITFIVSAVIMWWPAFNPIPERLRHPEPIWQMIYLFLTTLPMCAIGIFITMSKDVIYTFYAEAPRVFPGFTAIEDQVLGGIIMWVPGAMLPWVAISYVFIRWYRLEGVAPAIASQNG